MDSSSLLRELRSKVSLFDSVPSSQLPCRPAYGEASYWEDRYADEDASSTAQGKFEWLLTWADLAPVLAPELQGRRRLLHPRLRLQHFRFGAASGGSPRSGRERARPQHGHFKLGDRANDQAQPEVHLRRR